MNRDVAKTPPEPRVREVATTLATTSTSSSQPLDLPRRAALMVS
jgi:hypothetical protein